MGYVIKGGSSKTPTLTIGKVGTKYKMWVHYNYHIFKPSNRPWEYILKDTSSSKNNNALKVADTFTRF